ncbi:hypothetical protein FGG90_15780 (plasmid) [Clavibacter tessellarius]|nr:hypothetical protein FGG90_15780 [Clavibacter michiganensis subsp. tessellarius]
MNHTGARSPRWPRYASTSSDDAVRVLSGCSGVGAWRGGGCGRGGGGCGRDHGGDHRIPACAPARLGTRAGGRRGRRGCRRGGRRGCRRRGPDPGRQGTLTGPDHTAGRFTMELCSYV